MVNSRSFLSASNLTLSRVLRLTVLIAVALSGVLAISQPAAADLLAFDNLQCVETETNVRGNNLGAGFGFSGFWSTSSSKIAIACGDVTMNFPAAIPLNKSLNNSGKGNLLNVNDSTYSQNTVVRSLSNSIDFSQPGEYYLSYNQVQWDGYDNNAYITLGIGNGNASVQVGRTWANHSDAVYTTGAGYPQMSGIANAFTLSAGYTVLAKISVSGTGANTISYKVLGSNGTLPQNAADVEWDAVRTFNSTGQFNQIEARFNSAKGWLQINEIRLGTTYGDVTGFLDNPQAGTTSGLAKRSIGLNFTGQNASGDSEKALAASDFAGADEYVQPLWNNIRTTTVTGVPYSMLDSVGSMEYYKNQSGYMTVGYSSESQSLDSLAGTDANSALMSGRANGSTQVALGNIPYDYYDVVVYMGESSSDSIGQYWITDSEGNKISDTISVQTGAFDGTWKQVKSSGTSGNYYVFRGFTTDSMILNSADGPINAVQIVGHGTDVYLVTGDWSSSLTIDGAAYKGVQFDTQTTTAVKTAAHSGEVVLNQDALFQIGSGYTLTQSGAISGTGSIDKTGEGALVLSGANTYSGDTNIYGGTLKLTDDAVAASGKMTVGDSGTLEYNVASGSKKLTISELNAIASTGQILKTGAGTLQFDAAENSIDAQSLVVTSGRLDFKGYMTGDISIEDGVFSPGNSVGTANITGNVVITDDGVALFEFSSLDNGAFDVLNIENDGTTDYGFTAGASMIELYFENDDAQAWAAAIDENGYKLVSDAGFAAGDYSSWLNNYTDLFGLTGKGDGLYLVGASSPEPGSGVPEPSTWALLALGVIVLFLRKRVRSELTQA